MSPRASDFERLQMGVESTPGTAVTAGKILAGFGVMAQDRRHWRAHRPGGRAVPSAIASGKKWTEARIIDGILNYTDLVYPLSSLLCAPVIATPGGGTNSRSWTFQPDPDDPNTVKTFTVQVGSSAGADQFAYGLVTGMDFRFTETESIFSGEMVGHALNMEEAMDSATEVDCVEADTAGLDLYIGDTVAGLARLSGAISLDLSLTSMRNAAFRMDSTKPSFSSHVEKAPDYNINFWLDKDSEALALQADYMHTLKYLRLKVEGDTIESTIKYLFQVTCAGFLVPADQGDQDSALGLQFGFVPTHAFPSADNPSTPGWIEFKLINTLTAL